MPTRRLHTSDLHIGPPLVPEEMLGIEAAHHHFAPGRDHAHDFAMPGARLGIDCFADSRVEMRLGGHSLRSCIGSSPGFFGGHQPDRGVIIAHWGTVTASRSKSRKRDENTFNRVEASSQTLTLSHYPYFEQASQIAPLSKCIYPRTGRDLDAGSGTAGSSPA